MGLVLHLSKCFVFSFNILCLLLSIGVIAINALGLEHSMPGTDEHIFFIVGMILSALVLMITILGCYGVVGELLGVNIVYSLFILLLAMMQYLQMANYPTHAFYMNAVARLEHAWRMIDDQPYAMNMVENTYHCCGLYDSRDYIFKGLRAPKSCYLNNNDRDAALLFERGCLEILHDFYQNAIHREKLCNWALFGAECVVFVCSCVLSLMLYRKIRQRRYVNLEREPVNGILRPHANANHIGSRTVLLQD